MMEKIIIFLLMPLVIYAGRLQSQDNLSLVLLKGSATVKYGGSEHFDNIVQATRFILPQNSSVRISANSKALIYNENAKIEIGSQNEEEYNTLTLIESLKKANHGSVTGNFYRYLNHMYSTFKDNEESKGTVVGAVIRGVNDSIFLYSPPDSVKILSDTLELSWAGTSTKLNNKLVVINEISHDTIFNTIPKGNHVLLKSLSPGIYSWRYELIDSHKSELYEFRNIFIIPTISQKRILIEEVNNFEKEVSDFTPEVQHKLINDYFNYKEYYFHDIQ
jgi:hypothetical protein